MRTPRVLPRSPAQSTSRTQQAASSSTNYYESSNTSPAVYSFSNQYQHQQQQHHHSTGTLLPDTPPKTSVSVPGISPPRPSSSSSSSLTPHYQRPNNYKPPPRALSPAMTPSSSSSSSSALKLQQQQLPLSAGRNRPPIATESMLTQRETHPSVATSERERSNIDLVLAESMSNFKRAEAMEAENRKMEASIAEGNRDWSEKLRAAQQKIKYLQTESDGLRRSNLEQTDTIAKLREHVAQASKGRSTSDKLRTETSQLKEKLRDAEAKIRDLELHKSQLLKKADEKERTASLRATDVTGLRGQLHSREELVHSMSDTVRNRDATIAQLSREYQAVADELGLEKQSHASDIQHLETTIVDCKEREMTLKQQLQDVQFESGTLLRDRQELQQALDSERFKNSANTQHSLGVLQVMEERGRYALETLFAGVTEDHCRHFRIANDERRRAEAGQMHRMSRLLDDSDSLLRELTTAQEMLKGVCTDRDVMSSEAASVCDLATDTMRSLEFITSSATWRRAVLQTLIPEEISGDISKIRTKLADIVHRTNLLGSRKKK